jgi:hypothetical protein
MTLLEKTLTSPFVFLWRGGGGRGGGSGGNEWFLHGVLKTKLTLPAANGADRTVWKCENEDRYVCDTVH